MKRFLKKILFCILPLFFVLLLYIYIDLFKVFFIYNNYYKDTFITLNREVVCTRTFVRNYEDTKFDSFIFGSSRSISYKCDNWKQHLGSESIPFHFDAFGEGLYGIYNKIRFLDEKKVSINNALLIIDESVLTLLSNRSTNHIFISPPRLSHESKYEFYKTFIEASINPRFITTYLDYSIFGKYRKYMSGIIENVRYRNIHDNTNCDMWSARDLSIKKDSLGYYRSLIEEGVFYDRTQDRKELCPVQDLEVMMLNEMQKIFRKHGTNFRIVISPLYDQVPFAEKQYELLSDIFGKENIYDFSGVNEITSVIGNYYENSHYKPHVANEIMRIIYTQDKEYQER